MSQNNSVLEQLETKLKGKVIILGIGNSLRGDDAFGSALAEQLKNKITLKVYAAGSSPENFLGGIIKENPSTILFIDAVDFGGQAAEMKLFDLSEIKTPNLFLTHDPSPDFLSAFLKEKTRANLYLLAIQPQSLKFSDKMSRQMEVRIEELKKWFEEKYPLTVG